MNTICASQIKSFFLRQKLKLPRPVAIKILRELLQTGLINFFARTSDREIELPSDFYDSSRVFYTFAFDSPFAAASTPVSEKSETVVQTVTTVTKSVVFKPSHSNVISRMREDGSLNDMFLSALSSGESEAYRSRSQSFQVQSGRRITLDSSAIRERRSSFNGDVPRSFVFSNPGIFNGQEMDIVSEESDAPNGVRFAAQITCNDDVNSVHI